MTLGPVGGVDAEAWFNLHSFGDVKLLCGMVSEQSAREGKDKLRTPKGTISQISIGGGFVFTPK